MQRRAWLGVGFVIVGACGGAYTEDDPVRNGVDAGVDAGGTVDAATSPPRDAGSLADADTDAPPPACASGLARVDGGACSIVNPFADPSFRGAPANAWKYLAGAGLLPLTPGPRDLGVARLTDPTGQNKSLGGVRQTVTVPSFAEAGPLALEAIVRTNNSDANIEVFAGGRAVGAPPLFSTFSGAETERTFHECVGEAGYGTAMYEIFARSRNALGATFGDLDSVALVSDPMCPSPGAVPNGDFEGTGAWTVQGQATIEKEVGTNGSRGALFRPNPPNGGSISAPLSIPAKGLLAPALKLRTSGDGSFRVNADGFPIAFIESKAFAEIQIVCLPAWTRGAVPLFKIEGITTTTVALDDISLVDDASCAGAADPRNGDFESDKVTNGWLVRGDVVRSPKDSAIGLAHVAISGCTAGSTFFSSSIAQTVAYPPLNDLSEGTGVVYKYKYVAGSGTAASVAGKAIDPSATWKDGIACLPPKPAGTRVTITALVSYGSGCTPGTLELDAITISNNVGCP